MAKRSAAGYVKRLHIQIQPNRSPGLDATQAVAHLHRLGDDVRVTRGEDRGPYLNIDFATANISALWAAIREQLRAMPEVARAAIVVCEGQQGWDDYLLLHHFDPAEPLDQLAER
jgi:hypothetical protein